MKEFRTRYGIGKCKYVVSYHNGIKTHPDGSRFFDIAIFSNKKKLRQFENNLRREGYKAR